MQQGVVLRRVIRVTYRGIDRDEDTQRDGGAEFSFYAYSLEWAAQWLLSFGDHAEALVPSGLRELVCAQAERVAGRHADTIAQRS